MQACKKKNNNNDNNNNNNNCFFTLVGLYFSLARLLSKAQLLPALSTPPCWT